jgi:hypothetical protein
LTAAECATGVTAPNCSTRINPTWSSVAGTVFDSNSFYNSIEVRAQRDITKGLSIRFGYTHSSCYTDSSGETPGAVLNGSTTALYGQDASSSRGRCAFTANDRGTLTLGYDIPFFKSANSGLLNALFAGWQINTLTDVSRGFPMNVITGVNSQRSIVGGGAGPDRPNLKAGCTLTSAINPRSTNYINGACLVPVQFGYLSNMEANAFTGPSFWSTDASMKKDFGLYGDKMNLRLQVDMFNIFNRVNLGTTTNSNGAFNSTTVAANPPTTVASFGKITTIVGTPRQLQLGARFSF